MTCRKDLGITANLGIAPNLGITANLGIAPNLGITANLGIAPNLGITANLGIAPNLGITANLGIAPNPSLSFMGKIFFFLNPTTKVTYFYNAKCNSRTDAVQRGSSE